MQPNLTLRAAAIFNDSISYALSHLEIYDKFRFIIKVLHAFRGGALKIDKTEDCHSGDDSHS